MTEAFINRCIDRHINSDEDRQLVWDELCDFVKDVKSRAGVAPGEIFQGHTELIGEAFNDLVLEFGLEEHDENP